MLFQNPTVGSGIGHPESTRCRSRSVATARTTAGRILREARCQLGPPFALELAPRLEIVRAVEHPARPCPTLRSRRSDTARRPARPGRTRPPPRRARRWPAPCRSFGWSGSPGRPSLERSPRRRRAARRAATPPGAIAHARARARPCGRPSSAASAATRSMCARRFADTWAQAGSPVRASAVTRAAPPPARCCRSGGCVRPAPRGRRRSPRPPSSTGSSRSRFDHREVLDRHLRLGREARAHDLEQFGRAALAPAERLVCAPGGRRSAPARAALLGLR